MFAVGLKRVMLKPIKVIGVLAIPVAGLTFGVTGTDNDLEDYKANKEFYQAEFASAPVELEINDIPEASEREYKK